MPTPLEGVGGVQANSGLHSSVDGTMNALAGMDSQGFMDLLVAQMRYQDPMEPSDPSQMMNQTSALAQLSATQEMLKAQQQSFGLQQSAMAAEMLGTEVEAVDPEGLPVSGVVESVRYTEAGPVLDVGGTEVALSAVSQLHHTEEPASGQDGATALTDLSGDDPSTSPSWAY